MNTARKKNRLLSFLLALVMIFGMLPLASLLPTRVAAASYPSSLNKLVEGKKIYEGYRYRFYSNGTVESYTYSIDPEYTNYSTQLKFVKEEPGLVKYVAYSNGVILYWTKSENDFLDLSEFKGLTLSLRFFDNMKLSAIYAPGVNLKLGLFLDAYVQLCHSTRYKDKTGFCPQNGTTGAVIDLAQTEGSLGDCGTFELCGNGELFINTRKAPKKTSPDYAIVAKSTAIRDDVSLSIACGNSHRQAVSLILTTALTVDTTKDVHFGIYNTFATASAWSCHMNSCRFLNARNFYVRVALGSNFWKIFGDNGESDPVKVFKNYQKNGKIGREWSMRGNTESSNQYLFTMDHGNDDPRIRFNLNLKEVKNNDLVRDLEAGLGYEMSAEILYLPEWMQKLKDAGRIEFYFFGRLCNPGVQEGYEAAYLSDFYVDRTGRHRIEFYWVCKSATDPDNDTFSSTGQLKDYELTNLGPLYYTYTFFDVLMNDEVSGTRYIWNVKLQQDGGEFTEATNTSHKISLHPDTLAKCYPNLQLGIPSEWKYSSDSDAYTMYFWLNPRHGYEFAPSSATASDGVTLNVQHTEVTRRSITNGSLKALVIDLVAKRKLTDVSGTLKNFRLGIDAGFTEIVSNDSSKYTFKDTVVYDPGYGSSYGVEAGQLRKDDMCYVYFDIKPEFGYYIPENASVKVILPAGYRANGIFDSAETYSTVYKGDWISYSPINQKYRTSRLLEPNSEGKEYGTNILIKEPKLGDRPAAFVGYDKPTSLPNNMKVLSMQWLGPDQEPMRTYDKFEIGKSYFLDLRIGFEGGEEKGYVYPKNWKEFKVNGKSVNAWMEYDDNTNGHFLRVYESYKLVDPNASGTLSGTVKSYNSTTDPVTVQLFKSGSSSAAYNTSVKGNSATYTISGVASGTYTMKVSKKNHVTREYSVTVSTGTKTQNAEIRLLGDVNGDGKISTADVLKANFHAKRVNLLTGYEFLCADVNGDGKISTVDVNKINSHAKKATLLW